MESIKKNKSFKPSLAFCKMDKINVQKSKMNY